MDDQYCKDACLIIVGPGSDDDLLLAKRRLKCGGRLIHILTEGEGDKRVKISAFVESVGFFRWQPPRFYEPSPFASKLGYQEETYWTKTGPLTIKLAADQELEIQRSFAQLRHIRIYDQTGRNLVEMSGQ